MDQGNNNVINNYKGVMLCSRPNEAPATTAEKPFCGRVAPKEQIGLVPVKQQRSTNIQTKKPKLQILDRHKKWLDSFKKDVKSKKQQIEEEKRQQEQKMRRIKQQAELDRDRSKKIKEQYNQTATNVMNILNDDQGQTNKLPRITSNELTPENLNKLNRINEMKEEKSVKESLSSVTNKQKPIINEAGFKKNKKKISKPLWAQTQQQVQQNEQQEVDELLGFFQTNHVQDYAEDNQVKDILSNLKEKIQRLKQQEDWKEKQVKKIQQKRLKKKQNIQNLNQQDNDDKYTNFSGASESRSIASEKTQQKIQELKQKKKQQQEWDKFTTSQKSQLTGIDEKIAKNIADEVLRNYPNMRGVHSNVSIRKLLEQEAAKVMNQPINRPVITTVVREKNKVDANNLPYLHRNPAI